MKKISMVKVMILAMLVIIVFPGYGQAIDGCYQKSNGQLRILTDRKDYCRPSETKISLAGGTDVTKELCLLYKLSGFAYPESISCESLVNYKTVFVTSETYNGNLGGLTGADAKCQFLATTAGLPRPTTYMAWLSTSTKSPATRFTQSQDPYFDVKGNVIAQNWTELTAGNILRPIMFDEEGSSHLYDLVWTNTTIDGKSAGTDDTCQDWTSNSSADQGKVGEILDISEYWTNELSVPCDSVYNSQSINIRIYCFEQ